jgi:hypothetical protein
VSAHSSTRQTDARIYGDADDQEAASRRMIFDGCIVRIEVLMTPGAIFEKHFKLKRLHE